MSDVVWEPAALEELIGLARREYRQAQRVARAVTQLSVSGGGDVVKLQGSQDRWRLRVGDWRVIFIREGTVIRVTEVVNRQDAYR